MLMIATGIINPTSIQICIYPVPLAIPETYVRRKLIGKLILGHKDHDNDHGDGEQPASERGNGGGMGRACPLTHSEHHSLARHANQTNEAKASVHTVEHENGPSSLLQATRAMGEVAKPTNSASVSVWGSLRAKGADLEELGAGRQDIITALESIMQISNSHLSRAQDKKLLKKDKALDY